MRRALTRERQKNESRPPTYTGKVKVSDVGDNLGP